MCCHINICQSPVLNIQPNAFEDSSFSRSKDMKEYPSIKMGWFKVGMGH